MLFSVVSVKWGLIIIMSSVLSIYLSAYGLQRKHIHGAAGFSLFMLSTALFSIGYALEINSVTLERILDIIKFELIWSSFTAPAYFLFIVQFIRRKKIGNLPLIFLFAPPLIISLFGMTLDRHTFFYQNYHLEDGKFFPVIILESGPVHIIQLLFLISLSLAGEITMIIHFLRNKGIVKVQSGLIVIAGLMPTINAMIRPQRSIDSHIDTMPFTFLATGILMGIALFRYQMLDFVRVSRENAVDSINDLLVIVDRFNVIQDINRAGRHSILLEDFKVGKPLPATTEFSRQVSRQIEDSRTHDIGICQFESDKSHYKYCISKIYEQGKFRGFSLLINNNTSVVNLLKDLEFHAICDGLTGIFNRRHFMDLARRELDISIRRESSLAMIIFDIDHFKQVNDTYGHLTGDRVLKKIADISASNLRSSEILCRFGGEEFCFLSPGISLEESWLISERIRSCIEEFRITAEDGSVVKVTASFGIYHRPNCASAALEDFIRFSDTALYEAKKQGRNRSVIFRNRESLQLH